MRNQPIIKKQLPSAISSPRPDFFSRNSNWILFAILVLTAIVYSNSLKNDFTSFDDQDYIINNPYLKDISLKGIGDIFTSYYASNYHPLTTFIWAVEYKIFGENPVTYHLFNLAFHLFNIILVFVFITRLLADKRKALLIALLFAVHPLHVESVAWISERKDVLYACFFFLSAFFYLKYIQHEYKLKNALLAFIFFILSLLSKSAAVILPLILLVIDYQQGRKFNGKMLFEKIPFFVMSVIFGVVAILSQKVTIHASVTPDFPFIDRIFFASYGISYYALKSIIPFNLSALHFYPEVQDGVLPVLYYLSFLIFAALAFVLYKTWRLQKNITAGLLFFLASLSLVLQIIPVGQAIVAERYTYVAYTGLFIVFAEIFFNASPKLKKALFFFIALLMVYYCVASYMRNTVWKNSITLFKDVYEKYPQSYYSSYALANAFKDKGKWQDAIKYYTKSIELNPGYADSYNNRGVVMNQIKNFKDAISDFTIALSIDSSSYYSYFNCGLAYLNSSQAENAVLNFDKAIELKDDFTDAYLYRANAKMDMKKYTGSVKDYTTAIRLNPDYGIAYANRAAAYYNLHEFDKACADWKRAAECGFKDAETMLEKFCKNRNNLCCGFLFLLKSV